MFNDPAFMLYAMECEGETDTRLGTINKFVKILAMADDPNDAETQFRCASQVGLSLGSLSPGECSYIESEVERRIR